MFIGGPRGVGAAIRDGLALLTFTLFAVGAFAVARLRGFGRGLLAASLAVGVGHAIFDAAAGAGTRPPSALVWLVVWILLLGWLWTGRPGVVLSPRYREAIRATSHLDRKTSGIAWLALALLLVILLLAVWNFFAGGPARH